jgi:metal-dependent amidase/aminoacylase/carboxypeptidase family protein
MVEHLADIRRQIEARRDEMVALRRDLHAHPELSFEEHRTALRIAEVLEQAGLDVRTGIGRTGVSALLRGAQPGKRLLIRADIDALPITEESAVPYASRAPGVMHA